MGAAAIPVVIVAGLRWAGFPRLLAPVSRKPFPLGPYMSAETVERRPDRCQLLRSSPSSVAFSGSLLRNFSSARNGGVTCLHS